MRPLARTVNPCGPRVRAAARLSVPAGLARRDWGRPLNTTSNTLQKQDLSETGTVRHVVVDEDGAGMRLDRFLSRHYPGVPRTRLFRVVRKGEVRVNRKRCEIDQRLNSGDDVRLPPIRPEAAAGTPAQASTPVPTPPARMVASGATSARSQPRIAGPARAPAAPVERPSRPSDSLMQKVLAAIIYEDERLIVVNKPAGVAVHGGSGVSAGVIEALREGRPDERDKLELVHRLDRDTSGVLLIARRPSVLRTLHALLREGGEFDKLYLGLVKGSWQLGKKRIDAPLRTDLRVGGERKVKVDSHGKSALSDFRPVQFFGPWATLMEVKIDTGRTHQIRVHAAHAGHPVAGDPKYGDAEFNAAMKLRGLRRMFLHAASISFVWPDRGTPFSVNAPLPSDLASVIDQLPAKRRR